MERIDLSHLYKDLKSDSEDVLGLERKWSFGLQILILNALEEWIWVEPNEWSLAVSPATLFLPASFTSMASFLLSPAPFTRISSASSSYRPVFLLSLSLSIFCLQFVEDSGGILIYWFLFFFFSLPVANLVLETIELI